MAGVRGGPGRSEDPTGTQTFTSVKPMPSMKVRWAKKKTTIIGNVNMVAAAINRVYSAPYWEKKSRRPTDSVNLSGSRRKTSGLM